MHYLDNAATTATAPEVAAVISDHLLHHWANPSSLYRTGAEAEQQMEDARRVLAATMGASVTPRHKTVYFTSGGTEANNLAIWGAARARRAWGRELLSTGYEHPSVAQTLECLASDEGFTLIEVPPNTSGAVDMEQLVAAVGPKTALVCAMQVNNETGAVLDVATLAAAVKQKNPRTFVHVDGVQGFCKLPLTLKDTQIDSYAVSGHKLHAPKGIGALYLRAGAHFAPPYAGGGQEQNIRPGTENTAYIAGFAKAVELAQAQLGKTKTTMETLCRQLLAGLQDIDGIHPHLPPQHYPGIVIFSLPKGLRSQVMLNHLDARHNVCVSSGSACAGGASSHTLTAMSLPQEQIDSAIRVSFCGTNTAKDVQALLAGLQDGIARLARR